MHEAQDQAPDDSTGAAVTHLTGASVSSWNVYCEQPYTDPTGRYVLILRSADINFGGPPKILVSDLETKRLAYVDTGTGISVCGWGNRVHYWNGAGALCRFDFDSLTPEIVISPEQRPQLPDGSPLPPVPAAVHRDGARFAFQVCRPGTAPFIYILDLADSARPTVLRDPEMVNPHAQFDPGGDYLLYQVSRDVALLRPDDPTSWSGTSEIAFNIWEPSSGRKQVIATGQFQTAPQTGHQCFLPGQQRLVSTVGWDSDPLRHDGRHPDGNLMTLELSEPTPTFFAAPEHYFFHVSVSRCGTWFVCDDFARGHLRPGIVIGNLLTGKYRTLLHDCRAYACGGLCQSQPNPYFTADTRHVIYNTSPFGIIQVAAATLPDGFLQALA
jgi:hypothetical protein